jgi:uncharacterized protein (TIGR03084 family)
MATLFEEVIDDLGEEHRALERVLEQTKSEQFDLPTHAPGWAVRDQVAHLAAIDEVAALAIRDADAFRASARAGGGSEPSYLDKGRAMTPAELLGWWREASSSLLAGARTLEPSARMPWYGPDMSGVSFITARLMETWSHGLDVVDVVGIDRPDTDRLRHVAFLGVRTRPFSYANRKMEPSKVPVRVTLTAPSGAIWELGEATDENTISGPATDFCRVVTQRRHVADTTLEIHGEAAEEWMGIAQAFAGPPGQGRQPGEFANEAAQ